MKRISFFLALVILFVLVDCGGKQKESNKIIYEGEMIELLTPQPQDTFSWALVTGRASVKQGYFELILQGANAEVIQRRGVPLSAKSPDTVEFEMNLAVTKELPLENARVKAPIPTAEKEGAIVEAIVPVCIVGGSAEAHAAIVRFFNAMDTNDFQTAHSLLSPKGRNYPNLYGGEAVFAPRPKRASDLEDWKKNGEHLRLLTLKPLPMYDLPVDNLFCYRARVEHRMADEVTLEDVYVFITRQADGTFFLYRPRKEPHQAE